MRTPISSIVAVAFLFVAPLGCSFSASSESISKSISSSSESSSASSSPSDDEQAYREDVRDFTYAYIISGGKFEAFEKGLGEIAERHGVTDWEADDATYVGIGAGLAKAKLNDTELEVFKKNLAGSDTQKMREIQRGYDSVRRS